MDILQIQERIQNSLVLGESQFREFKSAIEGPPNQKAPRDPKIVAKDIAEALVSFANADGGILLLGVEDDGTVTGLSYDDDVISRLLKAPLTNVHARTPLPSTTARKIIVDNKDVLFFSVEKSTLAVHQTSDGKCLQRKDLQNLPVAIDQLQFERQEQLSREYDRQFVHSANVTDLDMELIRRVAEHITKGTSPEKCLQFLGLGEYSDTSLSLKRAALLLFAKDVTRWHPRCEVRIIRVQGTELKTGRDYNAKPEEIATGNILQLLTSSWEKLRPHLVEIKQSPDAIFKENVMYPEDACREALINAIAHRDYSIEGRSVEILIFDDRMEVHSPGGLLSTVRLDEIKKLTGAHQSRNALISRVLREIGYMREMGEGMRRIYRLMRDADLVTPEIYSEPNRFSIILSHKSVFSDADQRWLDGFSQLKLTREEMLVALLGKDGRMLSAQKIYDTLELVDWDMYRIIVDGMRTKGIFYTVREKGKSAGRERPRFAIRQPNECENGLTELYQILGKLESVSEVNNIVLQKVLANLSANNPYNFGNEPSRLAKLFKVLGLVDDNRKPSDLLLGIWKIQRPYDKTVDSKKDENKQPQVTNSQKDQPQLTYKESEYKKVKSKASLDVYIGNLDYLTTPSDVRDFCSSIGNVVSVYMPRDFVTQKNQGYAFVRMSSDEEAQKVFDQLNGKILDKRPVRVNWGNSKIY